MLYVLPGRGCLARMVVARRYYGLLKIAGRKSWGDSTLQVGLFMSCHAGSQKLGPAGPEEGKPKRSKPPKEWTLIVSPFGLLKVRLPCHVSVSPLDPHKYPDADRVFVTLSGVQSNPRSESGSALEDLCVKYDQARNEVMVFSDGNVDSAASLDVRTPVMFDLDLKTSGNGCVKIEQTECSSCKVETEKGTSILQSIKSQKIDIRAKGGNVICQGTLQGNTNIHVSQESSVTIEKLQGSFVNISSENGLLKTKYLYADSSFLTSAAGDILLGNVHGEIILETTTGNIAVDSLEGSLKASTSQGNIDAYILNQTGEVDLNSQEGSIMLKVPATLKASLQLSGSKVEVSPEIQLKEIQRVSKGDQLLVIGYMDQKNEKGKCIKAETQHGIINLKSQTWFQSVKLKIP